MTSPSPFEVGRSVSNQFGSVIRGPGDRSAIDEILSQASRSNNPADLDSAMAQILSRVSADKQVPAMRILESKRNQILQERNQFAQQRQSQEKLSEQQALNQSKLDEKRQFEESKTNQEKSGALQRLARMKELRATGHLGFSPLSAVGLSRLSPDNVRRSRGEYEQLGKSLISFATNIPIRNRIEFETLAEKLYDSSISDAEAEGIISAMESILSTGLNAKDTAQSPNQETKQPAASLSDIWNT